MTNVVGVLVRFTTFVAMLAVAGAVVFRLVVLQRATITEATLAAANRSTAAVGALAALVLLPASLVKLALQTAAMRFPDDPWLDVATRLATETTWGQVWALQSAAALLLIPALTLARRGITRRWGYAGVLAAVLLATPTLSSHAMSADRLAGYTIVADLLHVLGAASWLGTLGLMYLSVRRGDGAMEPTDERNLPGTAHYVATLLQQFSPVALTGATLVMGSGVISSLAHIAHLSDLFGSAYGQTLLAKLASVLVVLLFGWRNWKYITPTVTTAGPRRMQWAMAAELAATALVLVVTALLVTTPPPTEGMVMP